jgi:ketosteroid isomerase-like protein
VKSVGTTLQRVRRCSHPFLALNLLRSEFERCTLLRTSRPVHHLDLRDTARAMPQENVETVRRGIDAYNRGDLDGILENWASDAVLDWSNSRGFDAGVFRGRKEIRAHWQRLLSAFDEVRVELVDPIEVEDGLLIVENVGYLRGRDGSKFRREARG